MGDLLALIGGMFWAAIAMVTRLKLHKVSSEMNLLYQLALSGLLLTVVSLFIEAPIFRAAIPARSPCLPSTWSLIRSGTTTARCWRS